MNTPRISALAATLNAIPDTAERAAVGAEMYRRFNLTATQVIELQVLAGMIPADEAPAVRVNPRAANRAKLAAAGLDMRSSLRGLLG